MPLHILTLSHNHNASKNCHCDQRIETKSSYLFPSGLAICTGYGYLFASNQTEMPNTSNDRIWDILEISESYTL